MTLLFYCCCFYAFGINFKKIENIKELRRNKFKAKYNEKKKF